MKKHNDLSEKKLLKIKLLKCGAIVLAVLIAFIAVLLVLKNWEKSQQNDSVVAPYISHNIKTYNGKDYELKKNVDTFLVMGLDELSGEMTTDEDSINNSQEADFLMLFVMDNNNSTLTALHINRDSMVEMDKFGLDGNVVDRPTQQIALAHTYGSNRVQGCKNTVNAVQGLLENIDIDGYVSVFMDSVSEVNDILGGIEVEVLQDLTYADPELSQGSVVTLKGDQALTYVRTRFGLDDSSNKARMARQKQYVECLFETFSELVQSDDSVVEKLRNSNAVNNMEARYPGQLTDIANKLMEYEFCGIYSLEGKYETAENDKGRENMEFYPYKESIEKVLIDILYNPVEK